MDPFDCAIAIMKQVMAKSDTHQEKVDTNTKTTPNNGTKNGNPESR
jgi:hypothetical protein